MNKILNKTYMIFFLSFLLFGAVIVLITTFINYNLQYTNILKEIRSRFALEKSIKLESLGRDLKAFDTLVYTLATNKITQDLIKDPSPEVLADAENLFLASAKFNSLIMQIRLIDKNGKEAVRVDRTGSSKEVSLIIEEQLQDKSSRYYFIESSQLRPRQFWHSNLDLNLEGGAFEKPLRSTYRVATPVYSNNKFSGVVIVNIEAKYLIDALAQSPDFDAMIIDGDGEFIYHNDHRRDWSRYLEDRLNFLELFPEVGKEILLEGDLKRDKFYHFSVASQFKNGENLQVVLVPKTAMLSELKDHNFTSAIILFVAVILLSFPLSLCAAMIPNRLQSQLQKILRDLQCSSAIIDQNVISNTLDLEGDITRASYAFCQVTGYNLGELLGKNYSLLRHPDTPEKVYDKICNTLENSHIWRGELKCIKKSGEFFWVDTVLTPQLDINSKIVSYEQISQDITAKKEVEKLSITDHMTQLYNRRKIDRILANEMSRFTRFQQVFSVILLDLDHFKRVNDTFGHQVGDKVLISVALSLKENTRDLDCVGRWGGEEFLIVLRGTEIMGATSLAEKIRKAIFLHDFQPVQQVTASFGVAQCKPSEKLSKLISRVDGALYQAKSDGRNCVSVSSNTDKVSDYS